MVTELQNETITSPPGDGGTIDNPNILQRATRIYSKGRAETYLLTRHTRQRRIHTSYKTGETIPPG